MQSRGEVVHACPSYCLSVVDAAPPPCSFSKFNPFGLPPGGSVRRRSSLWESSGSESEMKSVRFTSDTDMDKASSATLGGRGSKVGENVE